MTERQPTAQHEPLADTAWTEGAVPVLNAHGLWVWGRASSSSSSAPPRSSEPRPVTTVENATMQGTRCCMSCSVAHRRSGLLWIAPIQCMPISRTWRLVCFDCVQFLTGPMGKIDVQSQYGTNGTSPLFDHPCHGLRWQLLASERDTMPPLYGPRIQEWIRPDEASPHEPTTPKPISWFQGAWFWRGSWEADRLAFKKASKHSWQQRSIIQAGFVQPSVRTIRHEVMKRILAGDPLSVDNDVPAASVSLRRRIEPTAWNALTAQATVLSLTAQSDEHGRITARGVVQSSVTRAKDSIGPSTIQAGLCRQVLTDGRFDEILQEIASHLVGHWPCRRMFCGYFVPEGLRLENRSRTCERCPFCLDMLRTNRDSGVSTDGHVGLPLRAARHLTTPEALEAASLGLARTMVPTGATDKFEFLITDWPEPIDSMTRNELWKCYRQIRQDVTEATYDDLMIDVRLDAKRFTVSIPMEAHDVPDDTIADLRYLNGRPQHRLDPWMYHPAQVNPANADNVRVLGVQIPATAPVFTAKQLLRLWCYSTFVLHAAEHCAE